MFRRQQEAPANVYQMKQELFSIGDDFWIENSAGQRVFKVDGKALRIRKTLDLQSGDGRTLYKIREALVHVRDTMDIETDAGKVATVKKALISPIHEKYSVDFERGGSWEVKGKITDHEYTISNDAGEVAEVGKKWFRIRDTYGIQVAPNQDDALVLAVAIVVDTISHPHR